MYRRLGFSGRWVLAVTVVRLTGTPTLAVELLFALCLWSLAFGWGTQRPLTFTAAVVSRKGGVDLKRYENGSSDVSTFVHAFRKKLLSNTLLILHSIHQ